MRQRTRWQWVGFAASRAMVLVLFAVLNPAVHVISDVRLYDAWWHFDLSHAHVPTDSQWNYPPGAAVVLSLAGMLSPAYFLGLFVLLLGSDIMIMRVVLRRAQDSWGPAFWMLAPLLLGPLIYARFDIIPTVLAVTGLVAGRCSRARCSAPATLVKVWPATILALAALRDRSAARLRLLIAGASLSGLVMLGIIATTGAWGAITGWASGNALAVCSSSRSPVRPGWSPVCSALPSASTTTTAATSWSGGTTFAATVCSLSGPGRDGVGSRRAGRAPTS